MDNQHRKIKGYRELSQEEIDMMNAIKEIGPRLDALHQMLADSPDTDKRWVAEGKTDLQKGLMSWTRSVAKPEFF